MRITYAEPLPTGTAALVLAAGGGSRFAGSSHKLMALINTRTVVDHALSAVQAAGFRHAIVVWGAVEIVPPTGAETPTWHMVHHAGWEAGMATSLQAGLATARRLGVEAVVVGLGDQPWIPAAAWRTVAQSDGAIGVATYGGLRSLPVRLEARVWPLLPRDGDEGARALMRLRPELVSEIPCEGNPGDIDTLEDLARWTSTTNSTSNDPSTKPGRSSPTSS